jgi:signal peptidase
MEKAFKIILNVILFFLIATGLLVVFSFIDIPGNYKIFTVQSGSMEPAIHTGSLIFVKPLADYSVGDIVTKKTDDPKMTVTHRVVTKEEIDGQTVFETKGDANDSSDGEKFGKDMIIGKKFLTIPFLGYLTSYAKTQAGIILIIIIPAIIIIYDEFNKIAAEIKKIRQKKIEEKGKIRFE